jgi:hypothetical protein
MAMKTIPQVYKKRACCSQSSTAEWQASFAALEEQLPEKSAGWLRQGKEGELIVTCESQHQQPMNALLPCGPNWKTVKRPSVKN